MQDAAFDTNPLAEALVQWFVQHGGHLSTHVRIVYSASHGFHMRATGPLTSPMVVTCPLQLSLSCLNLDPGQKEVLHVSSSLQQCRGKIPDHILTYLFLIEQRNKTVESPWHAYIACLPGPENLTTPLWFDEDDMAFLAGTSLAPAAKERKREYRQQYDDAVRILKEAGIALADRLKFETLLWAATIFTSRAFISTHVLPGQETVPVLFPVVDILNHSVTAKAEWDFQPHKSFTLKLLDGDTFIAGQELYNNYAPKQNDELLLGYGFCLQDNPIEQFPLKLASPVPPEYARQLGLHEPQSVPFGMIPDFLEEDQSTEQQFLRAMNHPFGRYRNNVPFFRGIPPFIVHSFFIQTLLTLDIDISNIDIDRPSPRVTLHILCLLHQAIAMRCASLPLSTELQPQNEKQMYAKFYRDGQAKIIHSIRLELEAALTKVRSSNNDVETPLAQSHLMSLSEALASFAAHNSAQHSLFQKGMQKHSLTLTNPQNAPLIWTLLLITTAALKLTSSPPSTSSINSTTTATPATTPSPPWLPPLLAHHPLPALEEGISDAETYTFLDTHLGDFVNLSSHHTSSSPPSDTSPSDILDDLGLTFLNQPTTNEAGNQEDSVFVKGKTENLGVRLVMWGMGVVEREIVPVWEAGEGRESGLTMCLFVKGNGDGDGGDGWMYDDA